jgi:hypothetical protein
MVPTSPHPLTPSGLWRHRGALGSHRDRRQVISARHAVIHERAGEDLAARRVIDAVLAKRLADALHYAAMDLALDDHRVQHHADIVDCGVGDESQLAGIRIDLDLPDPAPLTIFRIRPRLAAIGLALLLTLHFHQVG